MPSGCERGVRCFGAEHPRFHRIVRALDSRQIDEPRRTPDQRTPWKRELRDRLQSALVDRARTVRESLATFERTANRRMRLEALELVEGRKVGVFVVEVDDESHRDELFSKMVDERPAAGVVVERPALTVQDEPLPMITRRDLPQLLETNPVFLRIDAVAQVELLHP